MTERSVTERFRDRKVRDRKVPCNHDFVAGPVTREVVIPSGRREVGGSRMEGGREENKKL